VGKDESRSKSRKLPQGSDRCLQLDRVKEESLVITGHHTVVNVFHSLYTLPVSSAEVGLESTDPSFV